MRVTRGQVFALSISPLRSTVFGCSPTEPVTVICCNACAWLCPLPLGPMSLFSLLSLTNHRSARDCTLLRFQFSILKKSISTKLPFFSISLIVHRSTPSLSLYIYMHTTHTARRQIGPGQNARSVTSRVANLSTTPIDRASLVAKIKRPSCTLQPAHSCLLTG